MAGLRRSGCPREGRVPFLRSYPSYRILTGFLPRTRVPKKGGRMVTAMATKESNCVACLMNFWLSFLRV